MAGTIDYGNLMHRAMRGLIQEVLIGIAKNGLPADVEIADWLSDRYPGEMTVVIQHWFDNLNVTDEGFTITLNFGDNPETLYIPYDAIQTFVDPSVEFGLRFADPEETNASIEAPMDVMAEDEPAEERQDAEVVSLDQFRK